MVNGAEPHEYFERKSALLSNLRGRAMQCAHYASALWGRLRLNTAGSYYLQFDSCMLAQPRHVRCNSCRAFKQTVNV
jgi:hypothetical protein